MTLMLLGDMFAFSFLSNVSLSLKIVALKTKASHYLSAPYFDRTEHSKTSHFRLIITLNILLTVVTFSR